MFRYTSWDLVLLLVSLAHGVAFGLILLYHASLSACWVIPLLAGGMCWCANTVAHIQIHSPLFRARWMNRGFELYLSLLLGIPQSLWKERHLWHHAGEPKRWRYRAWRGQKGLQGIVVVLGWLLLAWAIPPFFWGIYLPSYLLGLSFCFLQGYYEHREEAHLGMGISYYNRFYNLLWFNDGYHIEHHLAPRKHWRELPKEAHDRATWAISRLPPHLRWWGAMRHTLLLLRCHLLGALERLALLSRILQRFMIASHRLAFQRLLRDIPPSRLKEIVIVGGGLFPRTLLVLLDLLPDASFTIIEKAPEHIEKARTILQDHPSLQAHPHKEERIRFLEASYDSKMPLEADALILPLAYWGERAALYRERPTAYVFIHDWVWRRKGAQSTVISWFLLKRLNLLRRDEGGEG